MILIGLGANLAGLSGEHPQATLEAALRQLNARHVGVARLSSWYETEPVPPAPQPLFVNAVAALATALGPHELLDELQRVEAALGRVRSVANAPRRVDLDLLAHGDTIIDGPGRLVLPHPRLHERAFVLCPLAEVAPNWRHPRLGLTAASLLSGVPAGQVVRRLGADRCATGAA